MDPRLRAQFKADELRLHAERRAIIARRGALRDAVWMFTERAITEDDSLRHKQRQIATQLAELRDLRAKVSKAERATR